MAAKGKGGDGTARRVVAVRVSDLPSPSQEPLGGLTLEDLQQLLSGTGPIEKISCLPFPRRGPVLLVDALIQYQDPGAAVAAVAAYHGASMTGGASCTLALALFQGDDVPIDPHDPLSWDVMGVSQAPSQLSDPWAGGKGMHHEAPQGEVGGRRVVLAHITSLSRPDLAPLGGLTLDSMHALFSQCGTVEKIACTATPRTGTPVQFIDAMIQFSRESEASAAVHGFDGSSLTRDNFCFAQMKFSKHTELRTLGNSERTRVFVASAPPPPAEYASTVGVLPPRRPAGNGSVAPSAKRARVEAYASHGAGGMGETRRVVLAHITELPDPEAAPLGGLSVDDIHTAFTPYGSVEKVVCVAFPKTGPAFDWVDAMVQFRQPSEAAAVLQMVDGTSLSGDSYNRVQCKWSKHLELTKQGESDCHRDYTLMLGATGFPTPVGAPGIPLDVAPGFGPVGAVGAPQRGPGEQPTPVLAVFNLAEEMAEPDILFSLFSLYGYVEIVKVVFKRPRDTALVQFSEAGFVDLAVDRLQGAVLHGRPMDVRRSKQASIRCTDKDQSSPERTTRSFTMADQFWSRKDYQRIWDNAASPSRTLFVKNIAPQLTELELLPLFRQHGTVTDFAFLPCKAPVRFKTAVVQMSEIHDAVAVVALVQRERFPSPEEGAEDMRLMVSFSKKDEMPKNVLREGVSRA
mmetsp:Transcript_91721/g.259707  ORF Transcript_91721/g.259707 Transcript_91721/m.259707 type:complete len:685 (-) Transcript_91721:79-2133(-)